MDREKLVRELLYQIRLGEDSSYEFKKVTFKGNKIEGPSQKDLADEIAAFANTKGGVLLLGVNDKMRAGTSENSVREVMGIEPDHIDIVQGMITRACQDNINPPITPYTRIVEIPDHEGNQKPVIYIEIDKSLFVHVSNGKYYHRANESKKEMTPDYLGRLMMQRSQARMIWFDEQIVPRTQDSDLDDALAKRFLRGDQPAAIQFKKLKLLVEDEDQQLRLSVAGALMATTEPHQWLPDAYIQAVSYSGTNRDAEDQLDAQDITGSLDAQVTQALRFVERNMKTAATKNIGRKDIPQYSLKAIFEALVNAVAHRDYAIYGSKIRLHMFADRLVLSSPGALVNTLEVGDLELRQATRNQLIATLLARCPVASPEVDRAMMMDKRGEGVPVIVNESERLSGRRPEYRMVGEELQLTVFAAAKD
ncbi:putative DNA binding domain-containing protein [Zooshikella marina]|uniref:ATP-binding protein n=1 Tax=Zooshikella ganghwensis TaxID=202772 RepID=UPI001BAEE923|nr:ATP-binding protein [Zooshikella ganghwensis]MBU2708646.1 putative DNA binding domain-containing protein [Zooshikella ganghwensis]